METKAERERGNRRFGGQLWSCSHHRLYEESVSECIHMKVKRGWWALKPLIWYEYNYWFVVFGDTWSNGKAWTHKGTRVVWAYRSSTRAGGIWNTGLPLLGTSLFGGQMFALFPNMPRHETTWSNYWTVDKTWQATYSCAVNGHRLSICLKNLQNNHFVFFSSYGCQDLKAITPSIPFF